MLMFSLIRRAVNHLAKAAQPDLLEKVHRGFGGLPPGSYDVQGTDRLWYPGWYDGRAWAPYGDVPGAVDFPGIPVYLQKKTGGNRSQRRRFDADRRRQGVHRVK